MLFRHGTAPVCFCFSRQTLHRSEPLPLSASYSISTIADVSPVVFITVRTIFVWFFGSDNSNWPDTAFEQRKTAFLQIPSLRSHALASGDALSIFWWTKRTQICVRDSSTLNFCAKDPIFRAKDQIQNKFLHSSYLLSWSLRISGRTWEAQLSRHRYS